MKKLRLSSVVSLAILTFVLSLTLGAGTPAKGLNGNNQSSLKMNDQMDESKMLVRGSPWHTKKHHHWYYDYWRGCWYWA
ncbi:hypothetical protein [Baia soyae]|uniref:Uncharacterized protein n=1 Tax=Baia soyae TaxID=1544746 RepID=A0A4R2RRH6_9BACL|nr:hypothetical protein [Baia soyae]TCP65768.1 hypothetical protein EDD57_1307 [Baia soyae]